jgi:hypothetical protein
VIYYTYKNHINEDAIIIRIKFFVIVVDCNWKYHYLRQNSMFKNPLKCILNSFVNSDDNAMSDRCGAGEPVSHRPGT